MGLITIGFKKAIEIAKIPTKAHESDAGLDFYSIEDKRIDGGCTTSIDTGIIWEPFPMFKVLNWFFKKYFNLYLKMEARSGLSFKNDVEVGAGVVDETYRGTIKVKIYNNSRKSLFIKIGDKICQGIPYLIPKIEIAEVYETNSTERGENGFGSSGR